MTEALSSCEVIAAGSGSNLANSQNSVFSFSRRVRAAFLLFSFMAHVLAISVNGKQKIGNKDLAYKSKKEDASFKTQHQPCNLLS